MPSSKGKPTDPKLRENLKNEIKNEKNKDGGGKGQWSAWKATKLSKEYEKRGGSYENEAGSKNEPKRGTPTPKSAAKKEAEISNTLSPDQNETRGPEEKKPKAKFRKKGIAEGVAKMKQNRPKAEGTRKSERVAAKRKDREEDEKAGAAKASKKSKK